jgi:uncharacterized protein YbdZ (MbtH family)
MKRSNDHEQFMRWQEYLSIKKGKEELSSAERKQEFQAFMEFESMKMNTISNKTQIHRILQILQVV